MNGLCRSKSIVLLVVIAGCQPDNLNQRKKNAVSYANVYLQNREDTGDSSALQRLYEHLRHAVNSSTRESLQYPQLIGVQVVEHGTDVSILVHWIGDEPDADGIRLNFHDAIDPVEYQMEPSTLKRLDENSQSTVHHSVSRVFDNGSATAEKLRSEAHRDQLVVELVQNGEVVDSTSEIIWCLPALREGASDGDE